MLQDNQTRAFLAYRLQGFNYREQQEAAELDIRQKLRDHLVDALMGKSSKMVKKKSASSTKDKKNLGIKEKIIIKKSVAEEKEQDDDKDSKNLEKQLIFILKNTSK